MANALTKDYTDEYIDRCFQIWYGLNQPTNMDILLEKIPETPEGKKPYKTTLTKFMQDYGWRERADAMDAKAVAIVEDKLITQKAEMLKRQAETAFEVAEKAKAHILSEGFDTSASAVAALKWAGEEERTVRGISGMLIKISKMTPEELEQKAMKLLRRQNESIEGEVIDSESDGGESADERSESS